MELKKVGITGGGAVLGAGVAYLATERQQDVLTRAAAVFAGAIIGAVGTTFTAALVEQFNPVSTIKG